MIECVSACGWSCTTASTATRGRVMRKDAPRNMRSRSEIGGTPAVCHIFWKRSRLRILLESRHSNAVPAAGYGPPEDMPVHIEVRLLGPLEVVVPDGRVEFEGAKQRRLFAALALRAPEAVTVDA